MRNFTRFIKNEKRARLDIFCNKLQKKEGEELYKILKNFGFTFCYAESDSMLAFLVGKFSPVKNIMKELEEYYGFTWTEDKLILSNRTTIEVGGEKIQGSKLKVERKKGQKLKLAK